jgi:hypothetical protein
MMGPETTGRRAPRLPRAALAAAIIAGAASALGAVLDLDAFLRAYLVAWLFWLGTALGCLGLLMLQYVTGGMWGLATRRILEASSRTIPLLALLFVPLAACLGRIYPWAGESHHEDLGHKVLYLNTPFFLARAALYFACWSALAVLLGRLSARLDREPDPFLERKLRVLSAPGLVVYGLTMTFAAFDWGMSLEPHWFSTMYGVLFVVGQGLAALSFATVAAWVIGRTRPGAEAWFTPGLFHDLGNLLLAFVMLWGYVSFSQYLIIWSGNLPEEIPWYLNRSRGGWEWIAAALALLHFAVPFVLLLVKPLKRDPRNLARVALLVLLLRWVDLYWILAPAFHPGELRPHVLDVLVWAGLGGIWLAGFGFFLGDRPFPASLPPSPAKHAGAVSPHLEHGAAHG